MLKLIKRKNMTKRKAMLIRLMAILSALITCGVFLQILGYNPIDVYIGLIDGAFGSAWRIKDTITIAIPLLIISLGILIAFKLKFWNIGAEGQICMGAFLASFAALNFGNLPAVVLLPLMIIAGVIGGALWALIPAVLKVKWGTNETIITLMLNYIALKWLTFLQYGPWKDPHSMGFPKIADFSDSARLPEIFGVHIGWIIALVLLICVHIFIKYTKKGYEITVVGESENTAAYSGMSVKKIIIQGLLISGGLCGLAGMVQASGVNGTLTVDITSGYGYTAIITTWLSALNTKAIMPVCLLFAALTKGSAYIQIALSIPQSAAEVLQSIILFFVLGCEIFIRYSIALRNKKEKAVTA